ncbi:MAG: hypothetical protein WAT23_15455 [Chromatiaceae bacterium]
MDQTRVTSGYDVEVAMGGRYLQYLLLMAVETGQFPSEVTFTPDSGGEAIRVEVLVPSSFDRTYDVDLDAPQPPEVPTDAAFAVRILPTHPLGADLMVTVWIRLTRGAQSAIVDMNLYVNIVLESTPDTDGIGLGSMTLKLELLDIDGNLVNLAASNNPPLPKAELLARLQPLINRDLSMNDLGTRGRIGAIHMKKLAGDVEREAALGLYINLVLRAGPQEDNVLGPRGDLTLAQNILEPGADITFATRASIYGDFANDAYHRMARRSGSGYSHPVMKKGEKLFDVVEIEAGPVQTANQLKVSVEGEYAINNLPDPNFTLHLYIYEALDADGILSWTSGADVQASILADILLGVIALATVPLLGPYSVLVFAALEAGKYVTQKAIAEWVVEEKTDRKVDAALLDVVPNRFTIVRRRWDPFFTTNHQMGLRPGATLINPQGLALWGTAALTRATEPAKSIIIREAVRDPAGNATHLIYRVEGLEGAEYLDAIAPGMHRGPSTQPHPDTEPQLFQLAVDDAIARVAARELDGSETYEVRAIEFQGGAVVNLLVISSREIKEQRNQLIGEVTATAEAAAAAADAIIRSEVLDAFDQQGIIPTNEQVEAEVAARKQEIVATAVAAYEENSLATELAAAIAPLLRFELSPDQFGRLQTAGLLRIAAYELVEIGTAERYYYRDRYVRKEELTAAARLADNLHSQPRYRNTPAGRLFM